MNISQQDIIKLIYKKNYLKLKELDSYFGDHNYIVYLENLFTFKEYLDISASNNLINRNIIIRNIKLLKKEKLLNIASIKDNLKKYLSLSNDNLIEIFKDNLHHVIKLLNDSYRTYKKLVDFYLNKIYNLQIINDIHKTIDLINQKYLLTYKNLLNQQTFLQSNKNLKGFLIKFSKDLIKKFNDEYRKIVFLIETTTDFKVKELLKADKNKVLLHKRKPRSTVVNIMAEKEIQNLHASSIELRKHLNNEIQKHQSLLEIKQNELNELRHLLEIESKTSLLKQKLTVMNCLKGKKDDVKMRLRSINELETNIINMRQELHRIESIQREQEKELEIKKNEITVKIHEIIKLEKLIAELSKKMNEDKQIFTEKTMEYNRKRNEILNDKSLTEDERNRMLETLSVEFTEFKKNHLDKLSVLQEEYDDLKTLSNIEANNTKLLLENLKDRFKNELEQLEQMKLGATSSELIEINKKVLELKSQYDKETQALTKAEKTFIDYKNDELGRFFMDKDGRKIYQRDSNASQYVYENDQWIKIADGDDRFFTDKNGRKIYQRDSNASQYVYENGQWTKITDGEGRFFKDKTGRKIYQRDSNASQYVYENGQWIKIADNEVLIETTNNVALDYDDRLSAIERQRIQDQEYIKNNLGVPLKLGLAAITINQPTDPINYLANFLLQYRYTTLNNMVKNQEFQDLMDERQRVSDEMTRLEKQKAKPKEDFQDFNPCAKYQDFFNNSTGVEEKEKYCDC